MPSLINLEVQKQYSPSMWSKRLSPTEVMENHIQMVTKVGEDNKALIPNDLDISYGETGGEKMDIFGKDTLKQDRPIFVYIHGGYWQELDKSNSNYCVRPLWKNGIRVIIPNYDLAPKANIGTIVSQIRTLATFVLTEASKSGVRSVWFGGHSAGAHLAAELLDETWFSSLSDSMKEIFNGLILISGIYDLSPLVSTDVNNALQLNEDEILTFSPLLNEKKVVDWKNLKVLITVAENDSPAFIEQTQEYYKVLEAMGLKVEMLLLNKMDHFDIVENLHSEEYLLTKKIISLILDQEWKDV